jgi:hypothetical protein
MPTIQDALSTENLSTEKLAYFYHHKNKPCFIIIIINHVCDEVCPEKSLLLKIIIINLKFF